MRTRGLWLLVAVMLFGIVASAGADSYHVRPIVVANCPVAPFVYSGYSYVPLQSASEFLGAALLWDGRRDRATVTYNGRDLGLVIGSTTAYYMGRAVVLPAPPIIVAEQVFVPVTVFDRYFGIPVRFDPDRDRVLICGRPGWGYYTVAPTPPLVVVQAFAGYGPPAWGSDYDDYNYYGAPAVAPAPFIYGGVTYLPLRDVTDLLGVALLWDSLRYRAAFIFNGYELGLVIGSPTVHYGTRVIVLPAPPIIVRETVYVPSQLFERHLNCPIEVRHNDGLLRFKGRRGWHDFRLASRPPGPISYGEYGDRDRPGFDRGRQQTGPARPAPSFSPSPLAQTGSDRWGIGLPKTRPAPATTVWTSTDRNRPGVGAPGDRPSVVPTTPWTNPDRPSPQLRLSANPWAGGDRTSPQPRGSATPWSSAKGRPYVGPGSTPWGRSSNRPAADANRVPLPSARPDQGRQPRAAGAPAMAVRPGWPPQSSKSAPADNRKESKESSAGWFGKAKSSG